MEHFISTLLNGLSTPIIIVIGIISLFTLGKGADVLVDQAVALSKKLGISKAVIGATIVSLGTTLPEASVSVLAAINGNPDLALGNAIGSIIVDTGLIIGLAAMISPILIDYKSIKVQSWIQILAGLMIVILSLPMLSHGIIYQWMGFMMVGMLILYMLWSFKHSQNTKGNDSEENHEVAHYSGEEVKNRRLLFQMLFLAGGVFLVIMSSKVLIPSVEIVAIRIGIPQSIIAATLVAFGTSLPELTTAIKAVRKGHGDLAVGNIIGADILNVLFVIGAAASFTPSGLKVPESFFSLQYPVMLFVLVVFRFSTLNKDQKISRKEAFVLLSTYMVYLLLNYL
ncbi:MAG: calcium/sodium antiporter [Clostridia bacterium]|nr:calcium/sodium antiporter [Clostridia bacterium]